MSLKFSDHSKKYEGKYALHKTIYDVWADVQDKTGKKIKDIQQSKTKESLDDDTTIKDLKDRGYLNSLTAIIEWDIFQPQIRDFNVGL